MRSQKLGSSTLKVEVLNISPNGIWLLVQRNEYFLPYKEFPWFKRARVGAIQDVTLSYGHHLYWKELDVDLELESLNRLEKYPLKYH